MFEIKSLDEIKAAFDLLMQETDASKKTKSRHLLERQIKLLHQRMESLEQTNQHLRTELEADPEYLQRQAMQSVTAYIGSVEGQIFSAMGIPAHLLKREGQ